MVAGLGEVVARRRASRASALVTPRDARLDPAFALELQKLLPHRFARELQLIGELCDRGWPLSLECEQNGPAAVGKLVYGNDGLAPDEAWNETLESNTPIVKSLLANVCGSSAITSPASGKTSGCARMRRRPDSASPRWL